MNHAAASVIGGSNHSSKREQWTCKQSKWLTTGRIQGPSQAEAWLNSNWITAQIHSIPQGALLTPCQMVNCRRWGCRMIVVFLQVCRATASNYSSAKRRQFIDRAAAELQFITSPEVISNTSCRLCLDLALTASSAHVHETGGMLPTTRQG